MLTCKPSGSYGNAMIERLVFVTLCVHLVHYIERHLDALESDGNTSRTISQLPSLMMLCAERCRYFATNLTVDAHYIKLYIGFSRLRRPVGFLVGAVG